MRQTRAWYWKGNAGYVLPPDTRMSQERQMILSYFRSQFQDDEISMEDITTHTFETACSSKSKPLVFNESAELGR